MQFDMKLDNQTRAILMATGGAAIAAVAAMFVPVGIWEMFTGSTGISEMIPATGAPLGDTARALIAFTVGALAFAVLSVLLLRRKPSKQATPAEIAAPVVYETAVAEEEEDSDESPSMVAKLKGRVSAFVDARRGDADVLDLEDLPKLRSGDAHPDAPPRRPLLATRDLADPEPENEAEAEVVEATVEEVVEPAIEAPIETPEVEAVAEVEVADDLRPETPLNAASLAEMIGQLESTLAERDAKLAQLEALVLEASAAKAQPLRDVQPVAEPERPAPMAAPVLEAVPPAPAPEPTNEETEAMDAALRSALETLHRMNARPR